MKKHHEGKTPYRKQKPTPARNPTDLDSLCQPNPSQDVKTIKGNQANLAKRISQALNAPFVASFTFLVLALTHRAANTLIQLATAIFFGTTLPLTILYLLSKEKMIPDFFASERESRAKPFIGAMASYVLGTIMLLLGNAAPIVTACMFCYFGNSLIMTLISLKWKISIHTSGISGPGVVLAYSLGVPWFLFMALLAPVGWARIRLRAHTLAQVSAGALVTIATTWIQLQIILTHLF